MKKSYLLLTLGGLALLSIGNAQASAIITGATGTGSIRDPLILGSGPITITSTNPPLVGNAFAEEFWFNFQTPGDYTLHYISSSASAGGSLTPDPLVRELPIASVSSQDPNVPGQAYATLAQVDQVDSTGFFNSAATLDFHDANNFGAPMTPLSSSAGPFDLSFFGTPGTTPFTYTFTFQAASVSSVPLPGVAWLMFTGLMSMLGLSKTGHRKTMLTV